MSCGGGSGSLQSTLLVTIHLQLQPSCQPFPRTMTAAVETKPIMIPFQSKQALIDEQIRSVQANLLKIKKEKDKQRNDDALRHKARSYHNQLRPKSAVFVDGSGGIRVFLPDSHGTAVDLHKKSG
ncbi:hypothetical protein Bca4012_066104 [Brassica carinata]